MKTPKLVNTAVFHLKKNSPHISFGLGVAGVVGTTVLACRATLRLPEIIEDFQTDVAAVKAMGEESVEKGTEYAKKEYAKDLGCVYLKLAKRCGCPLWAIHHRWGSVNRVVDHIARSNV
jgi:hypothetical protein